MAAVGLLCVLALLVLLVVGRSRHSTDLSDAELEWGLDSAEDWLVPLRSGWREPAPGQERPAADLPGQASPERVQPDYPSPERQPRQASADNRRAPPISGAQYSRPEVRQPSPPAEQRPHPAGQQGTHRAGLQQPDPSPPDGQGARSAYLPGAQSTPPPQPVGGPVPPSRPADGPPAGRADLSGQQPARSPQSPPVSRSPATGNPSERVPNGQLNAPDHPPGPYSDRRPVRKPIPAGYPAGDRHVPPGSPPAQPSGRWPAGQPAAPGSTPGPPPAGPESRIRAIDTPRYAPAPRAAGSEGLNGATNKPPGPGPSAADPEPGASTRPGPGTRPDPGGGQPPGPAGRPRSWFEVSPRSQGPPPATPASRQPGYAARPPVDSARLPEGSARPPSGRGADPPAPGSPSNAAARQSRPQSAESSGLGSRARPLPALTGQDALDDTCPLPVILPGQTGGPVTG
jgi:hypothetical protein